MPNQAEIKAFFSGRVEKDAQDAFDRELARVNMKVAGWGLPIILLVELFNIIFVLFFTRRGLESTGHILTTLLSVQYIPFRYTRLVFPDKAS